MTRILWLYTGGTIVSVNADGSGLTPPNSENAEKLNAFFDEKIKLLNSRGLEFTVDARVLFSVDSADMNPGHWKTIAENLIREYQNYDGFVITHGTDTMAYTSAALSLMLKDFYKPVILTGAQKPFGTPLGDAEENFIAAFRSVCGMTDGMARDIIGGVFICFGGKLIPGESAVKIHSTAFAAFADASANASADAAEEIIHEKPAPLPQKPPEHSPYLAGDLCEDVFLLKITPNTDERILKFIGSAGYKGVVCEAYGLGNIPERLLDGLSELVRSGVKVVVTGGCVYGGADLGVYELGIAAEKRGLISAEKDTPTYALIKLMAELGK